MDSCSCNQSKPEVENEKGLVLYSQAFAATFQKSDLFLNHLCISQTFPRLSTTLINKLFELKFIYYELLII